LEDNVKGSDRYFIQTSATKFNDLRAAKKMFAEKLIHSPRIDEARRAQGAFLTSIRGFTAAISPSPTQNVVGVGIGEKIADGKQTGMPAVKFLVRMKYSRLDLGTRDTLPKEIDGLPTDVEEVGIFKRFPATARVRKQAAAMPNPRTKIRPAQPGCSIGFRDPNNQFVMAGTFGALVKDKDGLYVLSNNHVLADENRLPAGAAIFQPGLLDSGNPSTDQIAALTRFITLQAHQPNTVDCAVAKATSQNIVSKDILYIGAPQGTAEPAIDMAVHKFGRTTGYTVGQVTSIDTDVTVQYDIGKITFTGQVIIVGGTGQPFSNAGDSGSLILQRASNKAVALLFAGSNTHTIANHIDQVLKALGVTLA
jgi:hypothetical protein